MIDRSLRIAPVDAQLIMWTTIGFGVGIVAEPLLAAGQAPGGVPVRA